MHHRPTLTAVAAAAVLAAALLGLTAQSASAAPQPKGSPAPAAPAAATPSSKLPGVEPAAVLAGYRQVTSTLLTDPANSQVSGTVACPANEKVVGGGAIISSSSLAENLNVSVPETDGRTWQVFVNNASATDGTFRVYADCVRRVNQYAVVIGTGVANLAGTQTSASVTCPTGTFPLGGGGFASSSSTAVNLNTSIPLTKGWRVDVNNASTSDETATAYAVCGKKPTGYVQVVGTSVTVPAGAQSSGATVACPTGTKVFGGGGFSSSGATNVDLNSSGPSGQTAWVAYENNGQSSPNTLTPYAVCGQAT